MGGEPLKYLANTIASYSKNEPGVKLKQFSHAFQLTNQERVKEFITKIYEQKKKDETVGQLASINWPLSKLCGFLYSNCHLNQGSVLKFPECIKFKMIFRALFFDL